MEAGLGVQVPVLPASNARFFSRQGNFRHTETHNPVSREELMMVLANLEQLQIRALFSQLSSSVSLRRVVLETATATATGVRASNVELCLCPANYQGDSCQVRGKWMCCSSQRGVKQSHFLCQPPLVLGVCGSCGVWMFVQSTGAKAPAASKLAPEGFS